MDETLRTALARQFGATIDMLENAMLACPDSLWQVRLWEDPQLPRASEFWYIVYHTLFWLDLYLSGATEGFLPPAPFTLDELDPAGILPERSFEKEELQSYLEHTRRKCQATIETLTDEKARQLCTFPWGEVTFAALLLDDMRHVQEHVAQLNLILGQKANWSPRWVTNARKDT
ncbi:MAG: DinB family protein [Chloroflexi bacterium]|nr:DinB family protein [Chloroflexota bacterium]